jgi:L-seryl-tRNA(Ser) seleniumtransferase
MPAGKQSLLRNIPSIEALLQDKELKKWAEGVPRKIVVDSIRSAVEETRKLIVKGACGGADEGKIRETILGLTRERIQSAIGPHYRKVINATGIILHSGLGRAVLPERALRQIQEGLSGYSLLQLDIETGKRSRRDERIQWLLQQLTGCEAAAVVNNNAAATAIVLNTLARGKEVIVSRGQLIEIGGSFRLPDVMAASGARLVEVGTTNKTHSKDYEQAITENTAAIMRVHPSNYKIVGFAEEVPLEEMVEIAHSHKLPLIDDIGAGALLDLSRFGFHGEPTLPGSIRAGADVVICSADKLIGASQGGLVLGKAKLIEAIRKNPFARIVRVGKLTLAVLEATLSLFLDEATALSEVPALQMLSRDLSDITAQAERMARAVRERAPGVEVTTVAGSSQTGGGSLPEQDIATRLVAISCPKEIAPDELAKRLRRYTPPIFTRVQEDRVLIDPRTLLKGEEETVVEAVATVLKAGR